MQKTFNLPSPPKPPPSDNNDDDNSAEIEVNALDRMPDWFAPPVLANAARKGSGRQPEANPPVPTDDPLLETLDPSPPPPLTFSTDDGSKETLD